MKSELKFKLIIIAVILTTQLSFISAFAESGIGLYGAMQKLRQMRLRSGVSPNQVERCLTSYINIIAENWRRLPAIQQKEFSPLFQRPDKPSPFGSVSGLPLKYKTTRFLFHYTVTGPDAVPKEDISPLDGIPDYVQICADAYEKAYRVEVELMGFKKPLDDYILADGGGDFRYDVYLFGGQWLGFTAPDFFTRVRSVAGAAIPFFGINSRIYDFFGKSEGRRYIQTTVAHEFLHSSQFSYNYFMYRWFMEATSTWIESVVYGQGNEIGDTDSLYQVIRDGMLRGWFLHPHTSLDRFDGQHEYGDVIWVYYLVDRFGPDIVKNIYEALSDGAFREMGNFWDVFSDYGTNLGAAFKEFTVWNYFTYTRHKGKHYKNGQRFPPIAIFLDDVHQSYPVKKEFDEEEMPEHFAAKYIVFEPGNYRGDLAIKVDGADIVVDDNIDLLLEPQGIRGWGAKILVERSDGEIREDEIFTFPRSQEGQMNFQDFGGKIKRIVLILANMNPDIDEINHPADPETDPSQLVGVNHKNSVSYIAGLPLKEKKFSEPKLHQNIDGSISVNWQLLDINGIKEVAIVRKRFAFSEQDQSNSPITVGETLRASDLDGNGISDTNLEIVGKVSPTTTSFIDKTILNDVDTTNPDFDPSNIRYFYAVVPVDALGLMGTPSASEVGISPTTIAAPAFFIRTDERALGEWEVQVASSHPLQAPPRLICVTPNSEVIQVDLQSYDEKDIFWRGTLSLKSFPMRGTYTFSISGIGKGGEIGNAILSGKKLVYYPPKVLNRMQLSRRIFKPMRDGQLEFYPRGMKVKIFSSSGEFIKELDFDSKWDGTNIRGERVGSGIYFYMAEDGHGKFREVGKVAVRW